MEAGLGIIVLAREPQVVLHRAELDMGLAKGQIADISGQLLFPKVKPTDPSRRITAVARHRAGGIGDGVQLACGFVITIAVR